MQNPFVSRTLVDPFANPELLVAARYGVIEIRDGRLAAIHLRRLPKWISAVEAAWLGRRRHARVPGDRCLVYYDQPRRMPNFLALKYVVSNRDCTLATITRAARVLDEVARLKQIDAIVTDAWNQRISERLLARWGWQPHTSNRWHRNYIKRFYGMYPRLRVEEVCGAC